MTYHDTAAEAQARPARPTTKSICPAGAGIIDNAPAHETAHTPPQACAAPPSCATAQQPQESPPAQLAEGYEHVPVVIAMKEALESIIRHYPNPDLTHEQYRVHACRQAELGLSAYLEQQGDAQ